MNISPISFGRIIKVNNTNKFQNASEYLAGTIAQTRQEKNHWVGIVKTTKPQPEHKSIQSQLQNLFYDANTAPVRAFMFENDKFRKDNDEEMFNHYIVTGEDSKKVGEILSPIADCYAELGNSRGGDYTCGELMYEIEPKLKAYIDANKDTTEININSSLTAKGNYEISSFEIIS